MLDFKETEDCYIITETIMSFDSVEIKIVEYTKDLISMRVNENPWREVNNLQREWFNKYYMRKFKEPLE